MSPNIPTDIPNYKSPFSELHWPESNWEDALEKYSIMRVLPCRNPLKRDGDPGSVDMRLPHGLDHIIFKSDEDYDGKRKYAMQQRPQDFRIERASKVMWIPIVLLRPDLVYDATKSGQRSTVYAYLCKTCDSEYWMVLVRQQGPNWFQIVTSHSLTIAEYNSKLRKWRRPKY